MIGTIDQNISFWPALYLPVSSAWNSFRMKPHIFFTQPVSAGSQRLSFQTCDRVGVEEQHQGRAGDGVKEAHELAPAEEQGRPEKEGVEHRQPGEEQEHEHDGHRPVRDAFTDRVAQDEVAVGLHGLPSSFSSLGDLQRAVPHVVQDACHQHREHGEDAGGPGQTASPQNQHRTHRRFLRQAVRLGPVAVRQHQEDVRAVDPRRVVHHRPLEAALVQILQPVACQSSMSFLRPEAERLGGTGLDARRLEPDRDPVGAERALVDLGILPAEPRDVERTPADAVPAADAVAPPGSRRCRWSTARWRRVRGRP